MTKNVRPISRLSLERNDAYKQTYYIDSVNASSVLILTQQHIGEQPPASIFLAPNLAFRCGLTPLEERPSYFMRVWPGGQGTMFY